MSTYRSSRFTDFSETHSPKSEAASERSLLTRSSQKQPHAMATKEQQTSEHTVHSTTNRSVPIILEPPPPLELHPMRLTAMPMDPMTVRWDSVTPNAVSPERTLHRMDQELQRLAGEMNRLWSSSPAVFNRSQDLSRGWTAPPMALPGDSELTRLWNQSALEREAELHRPWIQPTLYRNNAALALPSGPEIPRSFVKLNASPALPGLDVPWGATAHADDWRKKENFFIDNPVVRGSDGRSQFRLEFDLRQFNAGEINVRTDGHMLTVQAKHEESSDKKQARREYFRQCNIPPDVDINSIVSQLSPSGILTVSAPLKVNAGIRMESIEVKPEPAYDVKPVYDIKPV